LYDVLRTFTIRSVRQFDTGVNGVKATAVEFTNGQSVQFYHLSYQIRLINDRKRRRGRPPKRNQPLIPISPLPLDFQDGIFPGEGVQGMGAMIACLSEFGIIRERTAHHRGGKVNTLDQRAAVMAAIHLMELARDEWKRPDEAHGHGEASSQVVVGLMDIYSEHFDAVQNALNDYAQAVRQETREECAESRQRRERALHAHTRP
jgi:hypothetical protein